jgi:flagella synthesis protein FlgN
MKDALLATVIDETAAVQAFESLLAFEEKALTAASPLETLPSIIEQKTALTMQQAVTDDETLSAHWKELLAAAGRARRGNNNNGVLIRTRMEYNRNALAALTVAPAKSAFYGPDGRVPGVLGL